jgi:tRNA threonylcarbamoyladenosine biosynthesis protein TsaB
MDMFLKKFILSLETSTNLCSISIKNNNYYIEINNYKKNIKQNNNENILQNIDYIIFISKIKLYNINVISFNFGPGSFTGLRLSSAICQSISFYKKNLIRISSIQNIAYSTWKKYKNNYIFTSLHSKYNELYFCLYKYNIYRKIMQPIIPEKIINITNISSLPKNNIYIGNSFFIKKLLKNKKTIFKSINNRYPTAKNTAMLTELYLKNKLLTSINNINPNYIVENIF